MRLIFFLMMIYQILVPAAETDFIHGRNSVQDSSYILDKKMNDVLSEISMKSRNCDLSKLHSAIMKELGGFGAAAIEDWAYEIPNFIPGRENIYGNDAWACCSPMIKYQNTILSGDKLGHFLHSGYEMYITAMNSEGSNPKSNDVRSPLAKAFDKITNSPTKVDKEFINQLNSQMEGELGNKIKIDVSNLNVEEQAVFTLSHIQENGGWGLKGTGVKSYADIAANYEGYLFWKELTQGPNPYFKCEKTYWKVNRKFKWSDYISDAWDEGINCSTYNDTTAKTINARVNGLADEMNLLSNQCPLVPGRCEALKKRYKRFKNLILHPSCSGIQNEPSEPTPLKRSSAQ